jgi:hypothetical protein
MSAKEVGEIIATHTNGIEAAKDLVYRASGLWDEKVGDNVEGTSDDITVIVIFFMEYVGELEAESTDQVHKPENTGDSQETENEYKQGSSQGTAAYFSPLCGTPGTSVGTGQTFSSSWRRQTTASLF